MSKDDSQKHRQSRVKNLRKQLEDLKGEAMISMKSADYPTELEEQFLEYVLTYEQSDHPSLFYTLTKGGLALPHPDELDDDQLNKKLWQVIHGLSLQGAFLHNTEHLSDRELYESLWHDILREESFTQPANPNAACHIDMIGSGSESDHAIYLKYYADEGERQEWLRDFPEDDMPEHEERPYNRDCLLPQRDKWGKA